MEIKPQDLRIGNLIEYYREQYEVVEIGLFGILATATGRQCACKFDHPNFKPIELTPEWLERFGFNRMSCPEPAYRLNDLVIEKETSLSEEFQQWHWIYYIANGQAHRRTYTPFVHNLQNLYFALTGEELAIDKTSLKN